MKRLVKKALKKLAGRWISGPTSVSDNEAYPQLCLQASNDSRVFESFRRNPVYNQILEHVSEEQGRAYLELVSRDPEVFGAMARFRANDDFGNPRTFEYPSIGRISPSTLRYIKVLADLKMHFKTLDNFDICEIGVGYGGQCRIISAYFKPASYCLVDISPALALARRYLGNYALPAAVSYKTMNELAPRDYDLVISNYAFTELPRSIQDAYLATVIRRSRRGYISYNEIAPAKFKSYKADELLGIIPHARKLEEAPLTHPKNCIILWS
jgi:putative sugar O-methyltransferase